MTPTIGGLTERELVARIESRLPAAPPWVTVGIGDDAAVVEPERNRAEVLTVDALVEGVHFDRRFTPPEAIGHRALAVNLSDLAAMGAAPRLALLSLVMPAAWPVLEFERMLDGFTALARRFRIHVAGGNLTQSPGPLVIDVTVTGSVKPRQALLRRGARAGDELYVTGTVGTAAAGLGFLRDRAAQADVSSSADVPPDLEPCVRRYLEPEPRVRVGLLLGRNRAASACMDLSDGLGDAVRQLAAASGVGAIVDADTLPIEPGARRWFEARGQDVPTTVAGAGDDYELLFAARPRLRGRLAAVRAHGGVPLTRIGVCTDSPDVILRGGSAPAGTGMPAGFSHFR